MTYKYSFIRRELYDKNPLAYINKYRTFNEMRNTMKWPFWLIGITLLLSTLSLVILPFITNNFVFYIPGIIIINLACVLIEVLKDDHLYKKEKRQGELNRVDFNYNQYIESSIKVFKSNGIDSLEKWDLLKRECNERINKRELFYNSLNKKILDICVIIPIGGIVAGIMKNNDYVIMDAVLSIVILGLMILGIIQLIKAFSKFSNGYFKDQYVLDIMADVEYSNDYLVKQNTSH